MAQESSGLLLTNLEVEVYCLHCFYSCHYLTLAVYSGSYVVVGRELVKLRESSPSLVHSHTCVSLFSLYPGQRPSGQGSDGFKVTQ